MGGKDLITMEKYTKYEMARIIGARALQISMLEFEKGAIPITVRRHSEAKAA